MHRRVRGATKHAVHDRDIVDSCIKVNAHVQCSKARCFENSTPHIAHAGLRSTQQAVQRNTLFANRTADTRQSNTFIGMAMVN